MKKSSNPLNPSPNDPSVAEKPTPKPYKVPLVWQMFRMEGGLTLLILFPLVVLYYLKMAYR